MADPVDERTERRIRDAFAGMARPCPSPHFDRRLRVAVAQERRRMRAAATRMRVMQAYWILAGLTAGSIMSMVPWGESAGGAWLPLVVVTAVLALPIRLVRADLVDLLLGSVESLRRHT